MFTKLAARQNESPEEKGQTTTNQTRTKSKPDLVLWPWLAHRHDLVRSNVRWQVDVISSWCFSFCWTAFRAPLHPLTPMEIGRSQLSGCGVDIKTCAKLAESIIWSRSRFRGVDFFASHASGVDFYGRNDFKILKRKSPKRLRAWRARTLGVLHTACAASLPLGFYGEGVCVFRGAACALRTIMLLLPVAP